MKLLTPSELVLLRRWYYQPENPNYGKFCRYWKEVADKLIDLGLLRCTEEQHIYWTDYSIFREALANNPELLPIFRQLQSKNMFPSLKER